MASSGQTPSFLSCVANSNAHGNAEDKKEEGGSCAPEVGESLVYKPPQAKSLSNTVPELNVDLMGHTSFMVTIPRGRDGFGFTVFGCSPVHVGRVEEGSPAWASELRQDDCIVKINGLNVSRSTAESVAKLVRNSKTQIALEVFRPYNKNYTHNNQQQLEQQQQHYNSDSAVVFDSSSVISSSTSNTTFRTDSMDDDIIGHFETSSSSSSSVFCSASVFGDVPTNPAHPYFTTNDPINETKSSRNLRKIISHGALVQQRKPLSTVTNKLLIDQALNNNNNNNSHSSINNNNAYKLNCLLSGNKANTINYDTLNKNNGCLPRMGIKSKKQTPATQTAASVVSNSSSGSNSNLGPEVSSKSRFKPISRDDLDQSCALEIEEKFEICVWEMVTCLEDFVTLSQLGVNRFLKPLRAVRLSQDQFKTLFQNIETILSLSEQLLKQLQRQNKKENNTDDFEEDLSQSEGSFSSHVVMEAFVSFLDVKMESICDNYERYCNGLRQALITLVALKKDQKFGPIITSFYNKNNNDNNNDNFVDYTSRDLTLSLFLQQPLKHIKDMVLLLQNITTLSSRMDCENEKLKKIINTLRLCCNRINENHRSYSTLSLDTVTSSLPSLSQHGGSVDQSNRARPSPLLFNHPSFSLPFNRSSSSSSATSVPPFLASNIVSSIDKELLEIQSKLVFPPHIRAFHLATAARHLIYSGNLELVDFDGNKYSIFMVLMSDMLLMTRPDYLSHSLNVIEKPVVLRDIVGCEFHIASPLELLISVETRLTSLQRPWAPKTFCLRAPSEELKSTWKNILEQRILTCKNEREITLTTRSLDNIV